MIIQSTLMTCHKGVDLHAATAFRVIVRDIPGGDRPSRLSRAEFHCFWRDPDQDPPETVERLLDIGRFYNPNKHHYGHFEAQAATGPWFAPDFQAAGDDPGEDWPGEVESTGRKRNPIFSTAWPAGGRTTAERFSTFASFRKASRAP